MKKIYFLLLALGLFNYSQGQNSSDIDINFNSFNLPIDNQFIDKEVRKHIVLPDGKIIVMTSDNIFKLNGNLRDTSLNISGFEGFDSFSIPIFKDVIAQPDGKLIIVGSFYKYRGVIRENILRLNQDGSLDLTFRLQGFTLSDLSTHQLALQNDGKIILSFNRGSQLNNFRRINSNGTLDTSFQPISTYGYGAFFLMSDGSILVSRSQVANNTSSPINSVVKLDLNGVINNTFNIAFFSISYGQTVSLNKICLSNDGKIFVGGRFSGCNLNSSVDIARLNSDGTFDNTFSTGAGFYSSETQNDYVLDIGQLNDGSIIVVGNFEKYNNITRKDIVKLLPNGGIDSNFSDPSTFLGFYFIYTASIINNEKILISGSDDPSSYFSDDFITLLNIDGSKDLSFKNKCKGVYNNIETLVSDSNGKLMIGGHFKSFNGERAIAFMRFNADGSKDNSLDFGGLQGFDENKTFGGVSAIAEDVNGNGNIFIGGSFTKFNNEDCKHLIKINSSGIRDNSFSIGSGGINMNASTGQINVIIPQNDGTLIVGGNFNRINNTSVSGLIKLNANGSLNLEYGSVGNNVVCLALQNDGKLLVVRDGFTPGVIRFNSNSTVIDASFALDTSIAISVLNAIKVQSDGKIYLNGSFTVNGVNRTLLRINANGTIDSTFDVSSQNSEFKIASFDLLPDNKIIVTYNMASQSFKQKVCRLNANGTIDSTFNEINLNFTNRVFCKVLSDGSIIIYGQFIHENNSVPRGIFKISGNDYNYIKSKIRYDLNNNNSCDVNDLNVENFKLTINNVNNILNDIDYYSNNLGEISTGLENGQYTITPRIENPSYFTVSPSVINVTFPAQSSPFEQNFCLSANGIHSNVEISVLPIDSALPGLDTHYKIVCKNKGNQVETGVVAFNYDDTKLDFVSSSIAPVQSTGALSWNYSNLQPFETRTVDVVLNINTPMETDPVNGGDILTYTANITSGNTDEIPNDNIFEFNQTVVNSFDPNDKTCLEGTKIAPEKVGEYVHYMIRFENSGTANAQNIVVKDMIDKAKFDISSLVPIKGSYSFTTKITETNKVEFIFENINLPFDDANNDGYVAFKIKTKPTLVNGDTFSNTANIYFDYNFPIVTNTATTTIQQVLSVQDFEFSNFFNLYPNPVSDVLNIAAKETIEITSINIYNTLGQLVLVIPNAKDMKTVDVSSLLSGNYFIKINSDKGSSNTKFIKQ